MIIVSGVAGKLGRRVVELLVDGGHAQQVRALSRSPEKLADLADRGVQVARADFDDAATLGPAFAGGDVLLLISTDNIVEPGARLRQHRAAIEAAKAAGIRHVAYTSMTRPEPGNPVTIERDHAETEALLRASGLAWTMLRNNLYAEFLVEGGALTPGGLVGNVGAGRVALVAREDCAAAAAAVILDPAAHAGRTYEISGPEALGRDQIAALLAEALGRSVPNIDLDDDAYRAGVLAAGVPPVLVEVVVSFGVAARDGWLDGATTAVADLAGRPATPLRAVIEANRPAFLAALGG